jgi:hypothetical protein
MKRQRTLPWIMSYDDCSQIRNLYRSFCKVQFLPIRYSLQEKRQENELLISPEHIFIPSVFRKGNYEHVFEPADTGVTHVNT